MIERTLVPIVNTATTHMQDSQRWATTLDEVVQLLHQIDERMRS